MVDTGSRTRAEINFGALAAEGEKHLPDIFVASTAYERLRGGHKIIVLGNRGAGKTAILRMLATLAHPSSTVVVRLTPEDFAYELLSETLKSEQQGSWSKQSAYGAAWKYLLYVLAMQGLVKTLPGLKTGAAKRVYTYLRDNHKDTEKSPLAALVSYLKRLEGIKLGKLEASVKARELQRLYRLQEIEPLLDDLDELASSTPILILVDELDRGWDASPDAVAFVAGLFQAATSINQRTPHVRVVMSLRRELYENIPSLYEDAQKIRDTIECIDWDERRLFDMICRRIARSFDLKLDRMNRNAVWERMMPARTRGRSSFAHVLDFTLYRPREVIQFCNMLQDIALELGEGLPASKRAVAEAEQAYSMARFRDITAEYRFQYPALDSVLETFRGKPQNLSRQDLELICLSLSLGETRVDRKAAWVLDVEPEHFIDTLWRVGFLLCYVDDDAGRGRPLGAHQIRTLNTRNVE